MFIIPSFIGAKQPSSGFIGLLDLYPNAVFGVSMRRLTQNYTGPLIRVRRDNDNDELDIGYLSDGSLNTLSLTNFVGGNSGFITTFYDQSGYGVDLIQSSTTAQPQIIFGGTLLTENGIPVFECNASVDWLENLTGIDVVGNVGQSNFCVVRHPFPNLDSNGGFFSYGATGTGTLIRLLLEQPTGSSNGLAVRINAGNKVYDSNSILNSQMYSFNMNFINGQTSYSEATIYANGVEPPFVSTATSVANNMIKSKIYINRGIGSGSSVPESVYAKDTIWGEAIVYPFDQEALGNNFDIINNQRTYWGI